jgi:hypothetical protein
VCTGTPHASLCDVPAKLLFKNQLLRAKVENTIHDSGINKKKPM